MYDIKQLEDEWHRYNKKRKRPLYILLFIIVTAAVFITLYVNNIFTFKFDSLNLNEFMAKNELNEQDLKSKEVIASENKNVVSTIVVEKPSFDKKIAEVEETNVVKESPIIILNKEPKAYDHANEEPVLEVSEAISEVKQKEVIQKTDEVSTRKKVHLDILETSSVSAYKDVERRFYQTHDPDDSLFLAKSYFNRGEYKKAEYWALQTNKVDDGLEESWLLFAKSRLKLGYKQDAIKVLRSYIKRSNSVQAKRLLEKIK